MKARNFVLAAAALALSATAVQAEDDADKYIDFMVTATKLDRERLVDDGLAGINVRLGKQFSDRWNLELAGSSLDNDGDGAKGGVDLEQFSLGLNALWVFNRGGAFQPYLLGGAGGVKSQYAGKQRNLNAYIELGAGAIVPIFDNKARLRGEVTHRGVDDVIDSRDWLLNVGISIPFGRKAAPVAVAAAAVAAPLDTDGDGVTDDIDQCPNTPAGAAVDETGCELDSDGDGVVDSKDKCPGTPAGTEVDADGCPIVLVINLEGVNFRSNSADLLDGADTVLDASAEKLVANPAVVIEVAGHTDADGDAGYNQRLSLRRAEAVRAYLVGKGVDAERIIAVGYGESEPIASNDTRDGKARNRRVELRIQEK